MSNMTNKLYYSGPRRRITGPRVPTVSKTVKLPDQLNEQLRNYCFTRNLAQQDVILQAIEKFLDEAIPMSRRKPARHVPLQSAHQDYLAARERNRRTTGGRPIIDLTGQKFGHLTVLSLAPRDQWRSASAHWWVECDCPQKTRKLVSGIDLRSGNTKSCGCTSAPNGAGRRTRAKEWGDALGVLGDRERHVFEARFLADVPTTLQKLADDFGLTRQRVQQIELRAFTKVQNHVAQEK
jgi:hypothetical protein